MLQNAKEGEDLSVARVDPKEDINCVLVEVSTATVPRTRHVSSLQISPLQPLIGNYISRSTSNPTPGSNEPW